MQIQNYTCHYHRKERLLVYDVRKPRTPSFCQISVGEQEHLKKKAESLYNRLFTLLADANMSLEAEDYYNRAICLWCMHKVNDATQLFVLYLKTLKNEECLYTKLCQDYRLLNRHQINKLDILLMTDVVNIN